jgi:hypothetical protein
MKKDRNGNDFDEIREAQFNEQEKEWITQSEYLYYNKSYSGN